jgi:hypothetical protein
VVPAAFALLFCEAGGGPMMPAATTVTPLSPVFDPAVIADLRERLCHNRLSASSPNGSGRAFRQLR